MSHCTGVECCLDLHDPLQQTIHFFLDLDFCMQTLRVGVETLVYERTLFSYQYGMDITCPTSKPTNELVNLLSFYNEI